jgi:hypothetical protein
LIPEVEVAYYAPGKTLSSRQHISVLGGTSNLLECCPELSTLAGVYPEMTFLLRSSDRDTTLEQALLLINNSKDMKKDTISFSPRSKALFMKGLDAELLLRTSQLS